MGQVAVYTAVGQKTAQVKCTVVLQNMVHGIGKGFVFKEAALIDGLGDLGQFLIHDAAGTDVQMTNFGIPHLTVRKTYGQTAGPQLCMGIVRK